MSPPYAVRQLAELCARYPLSVKILLVPSPQAGSDLTTTLARFGHRWANLRVATPVQLAATELAPRMAGLRVHRLHTEGRQRLVESILSSWPSAQRRYFLGNHHAGAGDRGLVEPLDRTLDALRQAQVLPEHIVSMSPGMPAKAADLAHLYGAYTTLLAQGDWWDDATLFTEAMSLEHAPMGAVFAILDETELSPVATEFIQWWTGDQLWRLGRRTYGVAPPPCSAAVRFAAAPIPDEAKASTTELAVRRRRRADPPRSRPHHRAPLVQGDLFLDPMRDADQDDPLEPLYALGGTQPAHAEVVQVSPGGRLLTTGMTPQDADRVHLQQVIGLETEVRHVLRDVLHRGLPFDDVEIAYTATTPYQSLLYDAVARWELPASFASGIPTALTRPGRALVAFLGWIASDLQGTDLASRLRAGEIDWPVVQPHTVQPHTMAGWLLQGHAGAGREATLAALDRLAPPEPSRDGAMAVGSEREDELRASLAAGRAQLQALFDRVPDGDGTDALVLAAASYLESLPLSGDSERAQRDRRIREQVKAHLKGLCGLPEAPAPRAVRAQWLLASLRRHSCEVNSAQAGHMRIGSLHEAGYSGRNHLYILGLDESRFPGSSGQDPILLDEERLVLSSRLQLQATRPGRAIFHLIRVLGSAVGTVTLVASRLHFADGREPYPTPLFEQACRQLQQRPVCSGPVPAAGGVADDLEALLAQRSHPGLTGELSKVFPEVSRGMMSAQGRAHAAPSRFSGWIAQPDVESLGLAGGRVLSSRMLETLAECPRRYLWRYGLGLAPPEEPELDPRRWLQPMEMGSLLHGLFLDFMQQLQGARPSAAHETQLQEMATTAIEAECRRIPVTLTAAYRTDCRRIERAAHIFLHAEAQRLAADPALCPVAFELDFGFDESIEIRLSHEVSFRLRGRIDRVDAVRDASGQTVAYEIWDYKTGSTYNYDSRELAQGGRTLQWALYAYALPHLRADDGHVRLSGYFFASDRGSGQRFSDAPPARHELAATLQPLFDMARQGFFPALHKGDGKGGGPCRFCDYRRICATEARGADTADELLAASVELAALVDGWAEMVSAGRGGSRQTLEKAFGAMGMAPGDVAPEDAARSARDWINS